MAYVYKITNDINEKVYIGLTFSTIQERWRTHLHDKNATCAKNRPLYRAMNKYGVEHFHIEEIEKCDASIVNERETYWINFYDSYHTGYNATFGGEGRVEYNDEELYQLYLSGMTLRDIAKEKKCDVGTVSRYIRSKGIDTNKEHEQRHRELYGKKCRGIKDENILEFNTMMDAARYVSEQKLSVDTISGIQTHIGQVCNGKRKTAYGYRWEFIK